MTVLVFIIILFWLLSIQGKVNDIEQKISLLQKNKNIQPFYPENKRNETPVITQENFEQEKELHKEEQNIYENRSQEPEYYRAENVNNMVKKDEETKDFSIQTALLGNIFNKIGAIAIIIAMVIFIKLVSPYIILTPLMKIILGYLTCGGFIGGGVYLHKKENMKNYAEVLLGIGFAGLFITTFCAYGLFQLISAAGVICAGVVLLLATYFAADRMKTLSMLVIGLIGAYLTPVFANAGMTANLYYILFINIISLVFTLRNKNTNWINIINIIIAMCTFIFYDFMSLIFHRSAQISYLKIVFPIVLWGANIVYDLLRDKFNKIDNTYSIINYAVLTVFSLLLFSAVKIQLIILLAVTALGYLTLSIYGRNRDFQTYKFYDYSVLINIWLIILFIENSFWSAILWSILGLIITALIKKYDFKHLTGGMLFCYTSVIYAVFDTNMPATEGFFGKYIPLINKRLILFGVPVLSMTGSAYLIKEIDKKIQNLLLFSATTMVYVFIAYEINSIYSKFFNDSDLIHYNRAMTYVIIGLLYSLNTIRFGKIYESPLFDFAGKIIYTVSIISLVCLPYCYHINLIPILNFYFFAYAAAIATSILLIKWEEKEIYKYVAVILGFLLCHNESVRMTLIILGFEYIISLVWVLYSGIITIFGILKNKRFLINSGIFFIILSILRIFIYDLAKVDAIYKLIAFLALGTILLLVSYIYTQNKKQD